MYEFVFCTNIHMHLLYFLEILDSVKFTHKQVNMDTFAYLHNYMGMYSYSIHGYIDALMYICIFIFMNRI